MAFTDFSVNVFVKNPQSIPELIARIKDFSPAFDEIIQEWVQGYFYSTENRQSSGKFFESQGAEETGVDFAGGPHWWALRTGTIAAKRRKGRDNWLMVDTGGLFAAMNNRDLMEESIQNDRAIFGLPAAERERNIVKYQWRDRQVIFLDLSDRRMIEKNVQDYLNLGGRYKTILFVKGIEAVEMRESVARAMWGIGE